MIIYEVTTEIRPVIREQYDVWLTQHIQDMLEFKGFLSVQWGLCLDNPLDNPNNTDWIHYQVQYKIQSRDDLEHYLTHHAAKMRQPAIDLFGDQLRTTRRILEILHP